MDEKTLNSLKNIRLFLSDVDGVMTDATVRQSPNGDWIRVFNVYDGMGLIRLMKAGIPVGIITASDANDVRARFKYLKVDYFRDKSFDKLAVLKEMSSELNLSLDQVCYIGDDLFDQPAIEACGFGVTVPHALEPIKKASDYITQSHGGHGAVREVCEMILNAQSLVHHNISND